MVILLMMFELLKHIVEFLRNCAHNSNLMVILTNKHEMCQYLDDLHVI